jgi:hypothetical protein
MCRAFTRRRARLPELSFSGCAPQLGKDAVGGGQLGKLGHRTDLQLAQNVDENARLRLDKERNVLVGTELYSK